MKLGWQQQGHWSIREKIHTEWKNEGSSVADDKELIKEHWYETLIDGYKSNLEAVVFFYSKNVE